jgi:hypothetical protein
MVDESGKVKGNLIRLGVAIGHVKSAQVATEFVGAGNRTDLFKSPA